MQAQGSRYWKKIHGILFLHKKGHKNIIRKVFLTCEPIITVNNNTNTYVERDC